MKRSISIVLFVAMSAISVPSFAGEPVQGSGHSRSAAANDANERARVESQRRFKRDGCYTPARIESCKKTGDGDYICTANVANHAGSCR